MRKLLYIPLLTLLLGSCKTFDVGVPDSLKENADKLHVKGTSVSIFGHKIKVDGFGIGKMYSGFTASYGTEKRLFPLYFDLDKRLNYISNHFAKDIDYKKTKFSFDFVSKGIYANTYCVAKTKETSLDVKKQGFSIGLSEEYSFNGLIFTNKIASPWRISFDGSRDIRDGLKDYLKNVQNVNGILTNDSLTILVRQVKINDVKVGETQRKLIPFKIPVGFEFVLDDQVLGFVDLFKRNIWISNQLDPHTRIILISAATSILVKNNA
jgi:hypothetical protein